MITQVDKHAYKAIEMPYGWKAECSCGTFAIGFFTSADRAIRAAKNCSHPENKEKKS